MARFDRLTIYNTIFKEGLIPLFYSSDKEVAKNVTESLYKGGSHILEFTNRGAKALDIFSFLVEIIPKKYPDMILGVGTVTDASTAALFIAQGADFIVGPNFDEYIARLCNKKRVPYIPGAATVTEIIKAEEFGSELIKVFPGSTLGGPKFVKDILGPLTKSKIMPTGGVSPQEENIKAWFESGVQVIGMGSKLIKKEFLVEKNYDDLTKLVSQTLILINKFKKD
jgi:2-dehydro-3-deoxyphosphogluconate aldolase / (4S)-4-hydroxy-2-oxoglutarate aldolase